MAEAKQDGTVKQTEHQKKYDRQMRLWGAHGQERLENGKICMLGSNCAASETLKNCVLPAVGIFTIIDDVDVTISDLGNISLLHKMMLVKNEQKLLLNGY